jgi:hypothetical protein
MGTAHGKQRSTAEGLEPAAGICGQEHVWQAVE